MKKVSLSKMKCAALFAMMFFSYQGMAQNASLYVGENCKIYPDATVYGYTMMIAHLVADEQNPSIKYPMADKITLISSKNGSEMETKVLTSEYGNYVEFYDIKNNIFKIYAMRYAIIKNGSSLYLISHSRFSFEESVIYTITTDLEIADDFQIINYNDGECIYIKNNGILSEYYVKDLQYTYINSPKVDDREDATYSIDGKKVQTPHNGIFVKGDKKVIIK